LTPTTLGLVGPELAGLVTKFFRQLCGIMGDLKRYGGGETQPWRTRTSGPAEDGAPLDFNPYKK
jgi:hypothetical protein